MKIIKTYIENKVIFSKDYFMLTVRAETGQTANLGHPGQFYQIKITEDRFSLRLPISIYDIRGQYISFLVKVIGNKTKKLQSFSDGIELDMIGPLGRGFNVDIEQNTKYLFVTGGIGYAPLNYLYNSIYSQVRQIETANNMPIAWVHGGRSKDDVSFATLANIITTDDGTIGTKGIVTDEVLKLLKTNNFDKVYSCGPKAMMKALFEICQSANMPLEVSLEEYMACGVGVCHGCAVRVHKSEAGVQKSEFYSRVCKDGPVFDSYDIIWDDI